MRVAALLLVEQKKDLEFLSTTMEGNPPVVRLIREAVSQYIARKVEVPEIADAYRRDRQSKLRIITSGGGANV